MNRYRYSRETIAVFAALAIFLSTIEYMIPKPLPFLRLGLANLPLIISLAVFSPRDVLVLALLKVVGQGLVNGTLLSYIFLFSLAGTGASVIVMLLLYRLFYRQITLTGISVIGALSSNAMQLWLSKLFIFGSSVTYIAPPLITAGFFTSLFLGIIASDFIHRSKWLEEKKVESGNPV